jgi:uncharacterized protein (DUF983 family)
MNEHVHDIWGNNAAVSCPECGRIFIVSGFLNKGERKCPNCGKSRAFFDGDDSQVIREPETDDQSQVPA